MLRSLLIICLLCFAAMVGASLPAGAGPLTPGLAAAHPEPGDMDGDNVKDEVDNCPSTPNGSQVNTDGAADGGDACDADDDNDGVFDAAVGDTPPDNCRTTSNPDQAPGQGPYGAACPPTDTDGDGVIDPDDNCDFVPNPDQRDFDGDDRGDACDGDYDGDKFDNGFDNCPTVYNLTTDTQPPFRQPDADGDGIGTACDPDEGLPASPGPTAPGGAAGTPTARDTRAPTVRLRVARRHAGVSATDAFVVPVGCSEACSLETSLSVDARTAARMGLGRRPAVLAKGSWALAGRTSTYVVLDWQRRAGKALRRLRSFEARVAVVATDAAGNRATAARVVTLRR